MGVSSKLWRPRQIPTTLCEDSLKRLDEMEKREAFIQKQKSKEHPQALETIEMLHCQTVWLFVTSSLTW